jgi:Protein of unknown function (DUF3485)
MEKTEKSVLGFRLFVIVALAVTGWALVEKTGVANSDEAGIVLVLPESVGSWTGVDILFCPDRTCGGQYFAATLEDPTRCPTCGNPLDNMNWAERDMLPDDTGLVRKFYTQPGSRAGIHTTIVLSGDDRSSIHRPQVCMTAAGNEIAEERTIQIPLEGREDLLQVRVMDMSRSFTREDGSQGSYNSYYAYWFVGKGRETASHVERMAWMAYDRIFHGVSHRWAYIAMSGGRLPGSDAHLQSIANFASQLHPALLKPE